MRIRFETADGLVSYDDVPLGYNGKPMPEFVRPVRKDSEPFDGKCKTVKLSVRRYRLLRRMNDKMPPSEEWFYREYV